MTFMQKAARKSKLIVAGALIAVGLSVVASVALVPTKTYAASCDDVNIVRCGLDGSSDSAYINSFKSFYNKNSDNGHKDLQAVYNWAGISDSDVTSMNTANSKMGTVHRNGEVTVDGKVVATDAWVSARFTKGEGFVKIKDGVWARKTTTSLQNDSYRALVHYTNGLVDGVVMVDCGNAVKTTPVKPEPPKPTPPAPKPALKCDSLKAAATSDMRTFRFTAAATADNTKIENYTFKYSDGKSDVVRTSSRTAVTNHAFADYGKRYSTTVYVSSDDIKNRTGSACEVSITTPPAPVKPALKCDSLVFTPVAGKALTYKFVARATPTKTTITDYVFSFNGVSVAPVKTSASSASIEHTFAANATTYTASVVVNSTDVKNAGGTNCTVKVTTPKPEECKPGIPKGDARCNECKPGIPVGDDRCVEAPVVPPTPEAPACEITEDNDSCEEQPEELVSAGPGAVAGLFAGTSLLGAVSHRIIRKRLNRG